MNHFRSVAVILTCLVFAGVAHVGHLSGSPGPYSLRGTIVSATNTTALQALGIEIGNSFTVSLTVDPDLAVDTNSTPQSGVYSFPESPLTASVAGRVFSSTGSFVIVGDNVSGFPTSDFVSIGTSGPFTSVAAPFAIIGLNVGLTSSNLTTLTSDAFILPNNIEVFDIGRTFAISLRNTQDGTGAIIWGVISNSELSTEDQIVELMTTVNNLNVTFGTATSLNSKLGAALRAASNDNERAACGAVNAFVYEAQAQSGWNLTTVESGLLVESALQLLQGLGCS